uniref:L-dopachrome isomerase n=1 Tax=Hirondellea gigas TaxID=1518452 RepID=A0A2P2HX69_9CRUS
MPELVINTNVSKDKVTTDVLLKLSKIFCTTIGKPEQYCTVRVVPDQLMTFSGSTDACAQASIMSIGRLGVEENKLHSAAIFTAVEQLLGVPQDRMYITFTDKPSSEVGYKGTTFHSIMGK